jgi:acetyl-CoA decarbonylase/synthase, CODH/ACS complex subunit gamma
VTTNFALTYFIVSGEIEGSRVPSWLLVKDSEGLSVMTAWAAGKFAGDDVGMFVKKAVLPIRLLKRNLSFPVMLLLLPVIWKKNCLIGKSS